MNRTRMFIAVVVGFALLIGTVAVPTQAQDVPTLKLYTWPTYFDENTIPNFEQQFNAKVTLDTYASNEELLAKLQAGNPGFDIIIPSDYVIRQMIEGGLLEELNFENIPNFAAHVSSQFKNPPYDPDSKHCVAYQWGTVGIGYNVERTGIEITGWVDAFAPKFAGRVALANNARDVLVAGLLATGKDMNSTDRTDLEAARDFILAHKDVIGSFHDEDGQTKLLRGEADIVMEFNGDIYQVMEEDENIRYVIPAEGTSVWVDNLCIPSGAPNKELAEQFINYIYEPQVAADISNYTAYASPNQTAIDQKLIEEDYLSDPNIYPTADVMERLQFLTDLDNDAQVMYDEIFADIKAAIGQ